MPTKPEKVAVAGLSMSKFESMLDKRGLVLAGSVRQLGLGGFRQSYHVYHVGKEFSTARRDVTYP